MDPARLLATAPLALFLAYAVALLFFHVYFAYGLQLIAERQEESEAAQVLAWIPGLQMYTLVRCGGGSFATFLLLVVGGGLAMGFLAGLGAAAGAPGPLPFLPFLWALGLLAYILVLHWRLAEREGFPGAFSLLLLVPLLNLVAWGILAFHAGLRPVNKLGLVLGLLLLGVPLVPAALTFGSAGPMALAMAEAAERAERAERSGGSGSADGAPGGAELFAKLRGALEEGKRGSGESASGAGSGSASGDGARSASVPDPEEPFAPEYRPETGRCPPGSTRHGARPPRGLEQWCAREESEGRVRHGWYVRWHESGVRAVQGSYRDGERAGTWTRWRESGRKSVEAQFQGGEQNGLMRRFGRYGETTREVYYRDGEPVGSPSS